MYLPHRALTLVGLITLAACGSADSSSSDAVVPPSFAEAAPEPEAPVTQPTPATEPATTEPADTEPPATEPESTEPATTETGSTGSATTDADDPACLVGDWIVSDEDMANYYSAVGDATGLGVSITTNGNIEMSFSENNYVYDSNFDFSVLFGGDTGDGQFTGTAEGTWSSDGGVISTDLGNSDISVLVTIAGAELGGETLGAGVLQLDPLAGSPFSCDGPTIQLRTTAEETPRFPVVLTPA